MVWPSALVASSWARSTEPAAGHKPSIVSTSRSTKATSNSGNGAWNNGVRARALRTYQYGILEGGRAPQRARSTNSEMARLPTRIAAAASTSSAKAEGWAVTLDMPEALTMVALFCLSGSRQRATVRFVPCITHVRQATKGSGRSWAHLAACSCSRDAQQRSRPQQNGRRFRT
jgi:hypothetical protein